MASTKRYGPLPEIFGSTEAAAEIGVRMQNLNANAIKDLPEPDQVIAAGRVWRADRIRDFAVQYKARRAARLGTDSTPEQPDEVAA